MSITNTIQIYQEPTPQLFYTDEKGDKHELIFYLKQLHEIVATHVGWNDILSANIHNWFLGFSSTIQNNHSKFVLEKTEAKIAELRDCVLVCRRSGKPLTDPIIEQYKWTWEKTILDEHLKNTTVSPFNRQQMNPIEVHEFARSVLQWIERLPFEITASTELQNKVFNLEITYLHGQIDKVRALKERLKRKNAEMDAAIVETKKSNEEGLQSLKELNERSAENHQIALNQINKTQAQNMAILQANQAAHQEQLDQQARKAEELRQEISQQKNTIHNQQMTIHHLNNQIDNFRNKSGRCNIL